MYYYSVRAAQSRGVGCPQKCVRCALFLCLSLCLDAMEGVDGRGGKI